MARHTALETRIWLVETGQSRIFENWHKHTGVSKADFIAALEWLDGDPGWVYDNGVHLVTTRYVGCRQDGTLVRGERVLTELIAIGNTVDTSIRPHTTIYPIEGDAYHRTRLDFPHVCINKLDHI